MIAVHQPVIRRDVVVELVEHAPRRRLRRRGRIGTGLRIEVVLILERSEEPELVSDERTRQLGRGISPLIAVIRQATRRTVRYAEAFLRNRRVAARQLLGLPVVRRVAVKLVAALAGHDVEDGAHDVAVLG